MGHWDLITTMLDLHVLKRGPMEITNPAERLWPPPPVDIGFDNHWLP